MTAALRRRVTLVVVGIVVLTAALWFASRIPRTMTIFSIAAFIAFGVEPIVVQLERHRVAKPLAVAIVFVGLLLLIAIGVTVVVPATVLQVQTLAQNAPTYVATTQSWLLSVETWAQSHFPMLDLKPQSFSLGQLGGTRLATLASSTLSSVGTVVLGTATALFIALSSLVLSFFFLLKDREIASSFAAMFPAARRDTARALAAEITAVFGSFISGQIIVSAITGAVVGILSAIVGFKFALILGILTAVAYAVPIIGMLVAQVIAAILCAPQGWGDVLWVQIIMFGMARVSDNVLVPKIMGESVGVSPIGVMFAVFAGGELFGLPGLLLGIPAAALAKILWRYFVAPWLHQELGDEPTSPPAR